MGSGVAPRAQVSEGDAIWARGGFHTDLRPFEGLGLRTRFRLGGFGCGFRFEEGIDLVYGRGRVGGDSGLWEWHCYTTALWYCQLDGLHSDHV